MKTMNLIPNSPEWLAHRVAGFAGKPYFNASDAPAMMGCSPYTSRSELIKRLATGLSPDVDPATQRRFDDGHRFEALARPLAEDIIGEDLYPVTGTEGRYSASFDGLTVMGDIAFEHKTLNSDLRRSFSEMDGIISEHREAAAGDQLGLHYRVQMEHQAMVSGCTRVLFMASQWNGDALVEERHCWYLPDAALRAQIANGWAQLEKDLATYVPEEIIVAPVAAPQISLPAVSITVNGSIALVDNLSKFGAALEAYIERINKKPETDQDFADLEATVKTLKTAEDALDAAESGALAQTESIDTMRRTVALYRDTARSNRLLVEKLVKAEKENRRTKIVSDAAADLIIHIRTLNERLGKNYMTTIPSDFAGAVKGLKSLDSMRDKVSVEVARCKIEANAMADRIQANIAYAEDHIEQSQVPDLATLVLKAPDDFAAVVQQRLIAQIQREAETRERIRAEEQAKAEKEAREKLAAEQAEAAAQTTAALATAVLQQAATPAAQPAPQAVLSLGDVLQAAAPAPIAHALGVQQAAYIKLGDINARLAPISLTADGLAQLGFPHIATDKSAKLYRDCDFGDICAALVKHISDARIALTFKQAA
jgi:predicted phage-related endonuclease